MSNFESQQPRSTPGGLWQRLHEPRTLHPERFCPNCSAELKVSRCKLGCPQCGFYLSCSDFY
jgi:hypothetical protein